VVVQSKPRVRGNSSTKLHNGRNNVKKQPRVQQKEGGACGKSSRLASSAIRKLLGDKAGVPPKSLAAVGQSSGTKGKWVRRVGVQGVLKNKHRTGDLLIYERGSNPRK